MPALSRRAAAARALVATATMTLTALVLAPPAQAHNVVVSTEPAANSTLTQAPTSVTLHFEEPPVAGGTAIVVRGPAGGVVTSGTTTLTASDATVAVAPLTESGVYTVAYRSASDDGHTITGTYTFTVTLSAAETPTPSPTPTPTPTATPSATENTGTLSSSASSSASTGSSASGPGALPWVLGGLVLLAVAGAVLALLRRRSP
jgi:methionine-rich copper-binding protein CopC